MYVMHGKVLAGEVSWNVQGHHNTQGLTIRAESKLFQVFMQVGDSAASLRNMSSSF
jgi:hypothetical protein